jgi:hypothetical protein
MNAPEAAMDLRLEHYLRKISEYERAAEQGRDQSIRHLYRDWMRQWRGLTTTSEIYSAPPPPDAGLSSDSDKERGDK